MVPDIPADPAAFWRRRIGRKRGWAVASRRAASRDCGICEKGSRRQGQVSVCAGDVHLEVDGGVRLHARASGTPVSEAAHSAPVDLIHDQSVIRPVAENRRKFRHHRFRDAGRSR